MERFWKVLSLSLIVGILAALGAGMVFAQDDTPEPPYDGQGPGPWKWGHRGGGRMGFPGVEREEVRSRLADALGLTLEAFDAAISDGETLASLAEANGVSLEELRQVMDDLFEQGVANAVEEGRITQERADQILADSEVKRAVSEAIDRDALHAALAEVIGLTIEELEDAIASGERLPVLAEQAGVAAEELGDIMREFRTDAVAQAVAEGTITQEQADQMLAQMQLRGEGCAGRSFGPRGHGLPGGGFGKRGGFGPFSSLGDA